MANTKKKVVCYTRVRVEVATTEEGKVVKLSPHKHYWEDKIQMEFDSLTDAASTLGLQKSGICRALGNDEVQCGGMYWRYVE